MNANQIRALRLLNSVPGNMPADIITMAGLSRSVTWLAKYGYAQWLFFKTKHKASDATITERGRSYLENLSAKDHPHG